MLKGVILFEVKKALFFPPPGPIPWNILLLVTSHHCHFVLFNRRQHMLPTLIIDINFVIQKSPDHLCKRRRLIRERLFQYEKQNNKEMRYIGSLCLRNACRLLYYLRLGDETICVVIEWFIGRLIFQTPNLETGRRVLIHSKLSFHLSRSMVVSVE